MVRSTSLHAPYFWNLKTLLGATVLLISAGIEFLQSAQASSPATIIVEIVPLRRVDLALDFLHQVSYQASDCRPVGCACAERVSRIGSDHVLHS